MATISISCAIANISPDECVDLIYLDPPLCEQHYRKLQIFTIRDLLGGDGIDMPPQHGTFKQAERHRLHDVDVEGKAQHGFV